MHESDHSYATGTAVNESLKPYRANGFGLMSLHLSPIFAAARCSIFLVCFLLFSHWSASSCSTRPLLLFCAHFSTDSPRNKSFPFCECTPNVNVFELSPQSKVTFCGCFSRCLQTTPYWSSTLPTASSVENPTGRWPVAVLASFWSEEHVYRQIHWLCVVLLFV